MFGKDSIMISTEAELDATPTDSGWVLLFPLTSLPVPGVSTFWMHTNFTGVK